MIGMITRSQPSKTKQTLGELGNDHSNIRKRARNLELDVNRSISQTEPKQKRIRSKSLEMANANKGQSSSFVTDLSGTINTSARGGAGRPNTAATNEALNTSVGNVMGDEAMVMQRSLEDKVRKMVQEEMMGVKKTMGELARAIENLTRSTASRQRITCVNGNNVQAENNVNRNADGVLNNLNNSMNNNINMIGGATVHNTRDPTIEYNSANYAIQGPSRKDNHDRPFDNDTFDFRQIRMDKLGINFDNKSISVDEFIFRLEHLKAHYNISEKEVVRDFHLVVSGSVKDWYWSFIESHGVTEWPVLRLALLSQYKSPRSNFEIMRDLVERKQEQNETIDNYFFAMNKLRSRLTQPVPEYDMIKIIKRNINVNIARIVYPIAVSSVEQLRIECNEAERNFPRRDMRPNIPPQRNIRHINEVYMEEEDPHNSNISYTETVDVDALQTNQQQQRSTVTCWNCKMVGHVFMECPVEQRTLFCYKCGKPDVTTPKCPNCAQKNTKNGVVTTGEPRQKENPVIKRN